MTTNLDHKAIFNAGCQTSAFSALWFSLAAEFILGRDMAALRLQRVLASAHD
ncbi:MAG: hypothetical protein L0154_29525 [Chloroflexi bacterium]|nr:hypothetical protein [Chloroflexota bacterium]